MWSCRELISSYKNGLDTTIGFIDIQVHSGFTQLFPIPKSGQIYEFHNYYSWLQNGQVSIQSRKKTDL